MNGPHLQREIESKRNEFLDVYSLYLTTGITLVREEARFKAYELRFLDPQFVAPF